jgi:EAL domain-containing protein (putative c-di-GMP-specific phosphodiesterase class I)
MLKPQKTETRPSQELQLFEFMQRLARFRGDRRAVHVHLSELRAFNRRAQHIHVAVNTFEFLVKQYDGQIFTLGNSDLVFVWKGGEVLAVDEAVMRLRNLFSDDPLSQEPMEGETDGFCSWYDLERQYDEFMPVVQRIFDEAQKRKKRLAQISGSSDREAGELQPLSPHRLGELVDALARADLSNMMRRQPVCAVVPNAPPQPMFRELYISIDDLREIVMPGYNIASDRWLFQHLTQTLDRRMLQLLMKNDDKAIAASFSVNLNVATLLSDRFLAFDASLRAATRGTIIFELQTVDIFSDLGAYGFARDFVKERGYRICLDGVTDLMLPFIDRERLGVDLVKLVWNPDTMGPGNEGRREEVKKQITAVGRARAILCRCDSEEAVAAGQELGISLFQGRHIDRLLNGAGGAGGDVGAAQKLRAAAQAAPLIRR